MSQPGEPSSPKAAPASAEQAAPHPSNAGDAATQEASASASELPKVEKCTSVSDAINHTRENAHKHADLPEHIRKERDLCSLLESLPSILKSVGHNEMWGLELKDHNDIPTVNVLMKFLRANDGDVRTAEEHLTKALLWRKEFNPAESVKEVHSKKFEGLGYVTNYQDEAGRKEVFTWNVYGAVGKNFDAVFGDVKEFIRWRVALMEMAVAELNLQEATTMIPSEGPDPYQMLQVHDYMNVSFLRMPSNLRAATKETISIFSMAYPELLKEKFFINVPFVMGWMYTALKLVLSPNTIRKFHVITSGANLAAEFPSFGNSLPEAYGGKGATLADVGKVVPLETTST